MLLWLENTLILHPVAPPSPSSVMRPFLSCPVSVTLGGAAGRFHDLACSPVELVAMLEAKR